MAMITKEQIEAVLKTYNDPYLHTDPISAKAVKNIEVTDDGTVNVNMTFGFPVQHYASVLKDAMKAKISAIEGINHVDIEIDSKIVSHAVQQGVKPLTGVKNIIAVASGKGGVGKSTTAVNLALAIAAEGAATGLLDADMYGPSQPRMLGKRNEKPETVDGQSLEPVMSYNIQSMSIGYLIEEDTPMIWRGPMVTQALDQLLNDTRWKDLDYLVVDLPPGTGDTQLSLSQKIPVSGVVIVTTPQDIALLDAQKGLKMFEKVQVPVLGIVENMSIHICSQCGHEEHIFGEGGGQRMAEEQGTELLGSLPLDIRIRESADSGTPTVASDPEGRVAQMYREIARRITAKLSLQAKDYSSKFPSIKIVN